MVVYYGDMKTQIRFSSVVFTLLIIFSPISFPALAGDVVAEMSDLSKSILIHQPKRTKDFSRLLQAKVDIDKCFQLISAIESDGSINKKTTKFSTMQGPVNLKKIKKWCSEKRKQLRKVTVTGCGSAQLLVVQTQEEEEWTGTTIQLAGTEDKPLKRPSSVNYTPVSCSGQPSASNFDSSFADIAKAVQRVCGNDAMVQISNEIAEGETDDGFKRSITASCSVRRNAKWFRR